MKLKILKSISYLIFLFLLISSVSATNMTVQELIDSFDYDYYDGNLNVTNHTDYMIDANSNGVNDTLIINLTTDSASVRNFTFVVELLDKNGIIINATTSPINNTKNFTDVRFATTSLSQYKYNYTITIYDINDTLIFREYKIETQTYSNYEVGTNVTSISDANVGNNFTRISLTINSAKAVNDNITVVLAYNSSTISKTEEKSLSSGVQVVTIDFDNETIKGTHYNSNFTIDKVVVGDKVFDFNQNTSIYNYEDFAKTSYIKSIKDGRIDSDSNNLSEFLEINFTIEVKTVDTYTISYDLYDQFDNFVANISRTQSLANGTQNVQTLVNGSDIYKTNINGPYVLTFAKLHIGNDTKDIPICSFEIGRAH